MPIFTSAEEVGYALGSLCPLVCVSCIRLLKKIRTGFDEIGEVVGWRVVQRPTAEIWSRSGARSGMNFGLV